MKMKLAQIAICAFALLLVAGPAAAQHQRDNPEPMFKGNDKRDKNEEANLRTVQGTVKDNEENLVEGAVVQLKNLKTLQVRSFVTLADGTYFFNGLSSNIDYELRATSKGRTSPKRNLSVFDARKKAVINLKLETK